MRELRPETPTEHRNAKNLSRDLSGAEVEARVGPPEAVLRLGSESGGRLMWAYQSSGLYLYFSRGLLKTWRSYPHGPECPSMLREPGPIEQHVEEDADAAVA